MRKFFHLLAAGILSVAVFPSAVFSQVLPLKIYSIQEGIPQSVVQVIFQDSKGYFWFGTQDGLSRFDGLVFKNFGEPEGLTTTDVMSLQEDEEKNLVVGTEGGGVFVLKGEKFFQHLLGETKEENSVRSLVKMKENFLIALSKSGKIFKIEKGEVTPLLADGSYTKSQALQAVAGQEGDLWIATLDSGLIHFQNGKITSYKKEEGLPVLALLSLWMDKKGTLWLGTDGQGLIRFSDGKFTLLGKEVGLPDLRMNTLMEDSEGSLWVGTEGGICRLKKNKCEVYSKKNGLPVDSIYSFYQGSDGKIWIGTYGGGVAQLMTEMFLHYTGLSGLAAKLVYSIEELPNGDLFVGSDGGGIQRLHDHLLTPVANLTPVAGKTIFDILAEENGGVWVASYGDGVTLWKNNTATHFSEKEGLNSNKVHHIFKDSRGNLWFSTKLGINLYRDGKFIDFSKEKNLAKGRASFAFEDSSGNLWFSGDADVVRLINEKTKIYTTKDGLGATSIYQIFEDSKGILWFATKGGLSKLENGVFKTYTTADGLSNNTCYFVVEDERGILWIGTNRGLNRFDGKHFKVYTVQDGLLTNEFNSQAGFKDSKGNLWFGTIDGLTKLIISKEKEEIIPPPVYITSVQVHDQKIDFSPTKPFPYNQNYFMFQFISPYFNSPGQLRYRYILEGLDTEWHSSSERSVQYTSLPPHHYVFKVTAQNKDGVESETPALFSFTIAPPFWKRGWFLTLAAILIFLSLFGYYKFKVYQIQNQKRELEVIVHQRTHDLELEKDKSETLLCNILPKDLVTELRETGHTAPKRFDRVTILFSDFKGFTNTAATLPPEHLVGELDEMFKAFDKITAKQGLEKIKTIGDSYMLAGGLPRETLDHAVRVVQAAEEMQHYIEERNKEGIIKWGMRIGIHSGTVVAGVVGETKFTYDVWGDTVNIASRIESVCEPGRINMSAFTYFLVKNLVKCEYRGKVEVKGKGEIDMYYVASNGFPPASAKGPR